MLGINFRFDHATGLWMTFDSLKRSEMLSCLHLGFQSLTLWAVQIHVHEATLNRGPFRSVISRM